MACHERNSSAIVTILLLSDCPSLHNTYESTISNLDGSKMAADIVQRQEGASSAASSRKTLRLTWQCERHAVCYLTMLKVITVQQQSLPPRSPSRCQQDGCPSNENVAGSMYIPFTLSLHNALGYRHTHARLLSRTSSCLATAS